MPEILAPAGSREALTAALYCGADAVYVGGRQFSARSSAANFDLPGLREAARLCHLHGAKLHLAVNTLLTDAELPALAEFVQRAADCGVDACIVQDLGVLSLLHALLPDMPLHASTQMSIHTPQGAMQAAALGCSRVVAAREMSRDELRALCALPVETEVFVHGALCMSVSGQCSFSAVVGGRSANRGQCAQACRLPWRTPKGQNPAALSLKDLSLVQHVGELSAMGVDSFKIEGRMKRPEYVAAAVTALRQALSGETPDLAALEAVFSRSGFTDGYYTGRRKQMFGYRRHEDVLAAKEVLRPIAATYRTPRPVTVLDMALTLRPGAPAQLTACDGDGHTVTVEGDIPETALHRELSQETAQRHLHKLGGTVYAPGRVSVDAGGLILSAAQCNALRRAAVREMDEERIAANTPHYARGTVHLLPETVPAPPEGVCIRAHVRNAEQLRAARGCADAVCIPPALAASCAPDGSILIEAPRILAPETRWDGTLHVLHDAGFSHLLCHNLADLRLGAARGMVLHGGFGLNCVSGRSADVLRACGCADITAGIELHGSALPALRRVLPTGVFAYGRLPMMLLRQCPIRAQDGCRHHDCYLTDRTGRRFPLFCAGAYQELLNSEVLWLRSPLHGADLLDLYFYDESADAVRGIIEDFRAGTQTHRPAQSTAGLYTRGGLR